MKNSIIITLFGLLCLCVVNISADNGEGESYQVWIGGHYTDFKDYNQKIGEYRLLSDKAYPEIKINYLSQGNGGVYSLSGHYFDYENIGARFKSIIGNRFKLGFNYRSMTRQIGQDMMQNLAAREWLGTRMGGKYLTHDLADSGAAYNTNRQEISTNLEVLISKKHDLRLVAAHRSISEIGKNQAISNDHCFSCHLTSQTARVDKRTHNISAGLEGKAADQNLAYNFGYRKFSSQAKSPLNDVDVARHPVNGLSGAEFQPRLVYQGTTVPFDVLPEVEKMSHKVSAKGKFGKGNYAAAFNYSKVENNKENFTGVVLNTESYSGALNYAVMLSPKSRLVAKLKSGKVTSSDPFIDLPTYRAGRPGVQTDFDFTRYSSLDRTTMDGSVEYITRVNPKLTVSVLGGISSISRDDYPVVDGDNTTTTMAGQLKVKYRKGLRYTFRGKYRFEKTSDPFISGKGLFEARGRDALSRELGAYGPPNFIYYYEREALRYQNITTEPTAKHDISFSSTYRPTNKVNLTVGLKAVFDKNGDLDSLDVKHSMLQPNLNLTFMPNPKWTIVSGYTLNQTKSQGPLAVPLFDG